MRDKTNSEKVCSIQERKEILSEMARGKLTDYLEVLSEGGLTVDHGQDVSNSHAVQEMTIRVEEDLNKAKAYIIRVKLHDPVKNALADPPPIVPASFAVRLSL